ncbi:MAG: macro domain-containing protein, partial [Candidatus Eremiobacteraeota bacterium]|nr:macro domain-containing protein [Candidatus Eremiobacteraeota bacterium]
PTGSAVITEGGELPARFVIHAVAPRYDARPRDAELLAAAYGTALRLAAENDVRSIAFPSLGTGAYGYPIEAAAPIAIRAAVEHLRAGSELERLIFCLYSDADLATYRGLLAPYC